MFLRALIAFIALPGLAAIVAPPLIAWFDPWRSSHWPAGLFVVGLGGIILLWCVRDFYVRGKGTLAPWDPPRNLVIVGLYRFVRNPMYVGVLLLVLGWALYYFSPLLFIYDATLAIAFHIRVIKYEEPWLQAQFGSDWEAYRQTVSRWLAKPQQ